MGIFSVFWGILIDALVGVKVNWLGLEWNQYSIYFAALLLVLAIVVIQVMRVEEKQAANMNELFRDLIRHNPVRVWMRR